MVLLNNQQIDLNQFLVNANTVFNYYIHYKRVN